MSEVRANLALGTLDAARLLTNLNHFARLLRRLGLSATPGHTATAGRALAAIGLERRAGVRAALASVFVESPEQLPLFNQAFALFWRRLPEIDHAPAAAEASETALLKRRLADALQLAETVPADRLRRESEGGAADTAQIRTQDFEQMSEAEWRAAQRCVRLLTARLAPIPGRRRRLSAQGSVDLPRSVRAAFRRAGEWAELRRSERRPRPTELVVLADISGSMAGYARMLVQLIVALGRHHPGRVHAYLCGTRLTALGPRLPHDWDAATAAIAAATDDWSGGTRLGSALAEFNRRSAPRVLGPAALVLLATDGLERGGADRLTAELKFLRRSCRRLWWLNPLLRADRYQPLAAGAAALERYADRRLPIHNLRSLEALCTALGRPDGATLDVDSRFLPAAHATQ